MLRKVTLYGDLGEKFGREWTLDVSNPHEAAKAIEANMPGFYEYIMDREYHVTSAEEYLGQQHLMDPLGSRDLKFIPIISGSKSSGVGMILLGALIVFVPYLAGLATGVGTGSTFASTWAVGMGTFGVGASTAVSLSSFALQAGMSLMMSGIAQMLAPKPNKPQTSEVNNGQSYNFNGPVNTSAQGLPIPLCYGELIVGGALISAGVTTEETDGQ